MEHAHPDYPNILIASEAKSNPWATDENARYSKELISYIASRQTGKAILDAMHSTGKRAVIVPFVSTEANPVNAESKADSTAAATPKGQYALQCGDSGQGQPVKELWYGLFPAKVKGTGQGSNIHIYFTPSMWKTPPKLNFKSNATGDAAEMLADEVLLHEMLHGYRQMTGRLLCTTEAMGDYDTFEEFFSIVVTNIYTSEAGGKKAKLRADHHGYEKLKNIKSFLKDNLAGLRRINGENPDLVVRLGIQVLAADFNPFREFLRQPAGAIRG